MSETFILIHKLKMLNLLNIPQLYARGTKFMFGEVDIYRQNYHLFTHNVEMK
jgi:hypothetical protein